MFKTSILKKVSILLISIGVITSSYFAFFYKQIPFWRVNEYRTEMETIINNWIPKSEKIINDEVSKAKEYKNKIINNKLSRESQEYFDLALTSEFASSTALLHLYAELVKTTNKYTAMPKLHTDFYGVPANIIEPYLKKYKVDTNKLYELEAYVLDKNKTIEQYVEEAEKVIDTNYVSEYKKPTIKRIGIVKKRFV